MQASWNWPFDHKDLEVYGRTGQAPTVGRTHVRTRLDDQPESTRPAPSLTPADDPLRYFAAVVRGEVQPSGLSALRNNLIVWKSSTRSAVRPRANARSA